MNLANWRILNEFSEMGKFDKLCGFGESVESGELFFGRLRTLLRCRWQLDIGSDSISVVPCIFYLGDFDSDLKVSDQLKVLGIIVSSSGSIEPDFADAKKRAWKSF